MGTKVCSIVRERQVDFVKFFFNTNEIDGLNAPFTGEGLFRDSDIKANYIVKIPPERLSIKTTTGAPLFIDGTMKKIIHTNKIKYFSFVSGSVFEVPVPSSHTGASQSLSVRLIAPFRTRGMIGACNASHG